MNIQGVEQSLHRQRGGKYKPGSVFDQVTNSGIVVVVGLFVTGLFVMGFFFLWVVDSMVILDVGFVFGETVVDGCVVWMILIVVLVG